jgi:hypothetical protein
MARSTKSKASEAPPAVEPESTVKQQGLPLFFKKPAALEKSRHAASGLVTDIGLAFARETNSIPLNALEFIEAAKCYPIVFSNGEQPAVLSIVGLERKNYFVEADGGWRKDCYVPAYVRQYPFVFFEQPNDKKFYLCVDEKSPHFRADGGRGVTPLFNKDGTPSPMTNQALEFCQSYYQHHSITRAFVADLVAHKLLAPYHSQVQITSGRKLSLSDFSMIDEAAVNALPDEVYLQFRSKGWLPFIYLALASASNWKRLAALAEAAEGLQ